jgi:hypothetical protein
MNRRIICVVVLTLCMGGAGCATTSNPVSILYSPFAEVKGGSGNLFLKIASGHTVRNNADSERWVIGKQKDSEGTVTGEILSTSSEEDMMLDAIKRELTAAGYSVELGSTIPEGVPKGVDLTSMQVEVNETDGIPKIEAEGRVKISMNVWKNGVIVKKLGYESKVSDFAIIDRSLLPREMIERGLHEVMSQAVPDIISTLERKPAK